MKKDVKKISTKSEPSTVIEESDNNSSSESSSDSSSGEETVITTKETKPSTLRDGKTSEQATPTKTKRPYVMTEARKEAFEKARITRAKNIATRKAIKDKEAEEFNKKKEVKVMKKTMKLKKKEEQALQELDTSSDDEPIIVRKKRSRKPRVVYVSDDSEDEKKIVIVNKIEAPKPLPPVPPQRKAPMFV